MKLSCIVILILGIMLSGSAAAKIYRYVDDNGQAVFTDDLSSLSESNRAKATEHDEIPSTYTSPSTTRAIGSGPTTSPEASPSKSSQNQEKKRQKQQLESEYQELLKGKEALDNNVSFQTRRKKSKYRYRPYIIELEKKEQQITQRLTELEQELKAFE